jgi:hypothetical protein
MDGSLFIEGESAEDREARLIAYSQAHPLVAEWCNHDECEFRCYPGDGECKCGVHKHHVHGTCGRILQVG